jgi:hypothetical protein
MRAIKVKVMTAPETAALLRQQLGPIVAWDDWLSDRRRGRGDQLADFDLQPCASLKDRCRRPVYAIEDIVEFIKSVRRRHSTAKPGIKPDVMVIQLDGDDCRSWKMRPPAPLCTTA